MLLVACFKAVAILVKGLFWILVLPFKLLGAVASGILWLFLLPFKLFFGLLVGIIAVGLGLLLAIIGLIAIPVIPIAIIASGGYIIHVMVSRRQRRTAVQT